MKKILIISVLSVCINIIYAQDKIIKLTGDTISCRVSEITDDYVKYRYEREDVLNNISKNIIKEIVFISGRVQKFNELIIITGEDDWEKVHVTNLESDIKGLVKICEVNVKSNAVMSRDVGKQQQKAMEKLKREAAKKGAHIVLLLDEHTTTYRGAPSVAISGILYKYK